MYEWGESGNNREKNECPLVFEKKCKGNRFGTWYYLDGIGVIMHALNGDYHSHIAKLLESNSIK